MGDNMGFQLVMGVTPNTLDGMGTSWNIPRTKWMMTGGTPIHGHPHILLLMDLHFAKRKRGEVFFKVCFFRMFIEKYDKSWKNQLSLLQIQGGFRGERTPNLPRLSCSEISCDRFLEVPPLTSG